NPLAQHLRARHPQERSGGCGEVMKTMRHALTAWLLIACLVQIAPADEPTLDWVKVTANAGWQPRDSQGEVVYRDRLWIFGGWFNSYAAPPRDVWNSADGKNWSLVEQAAPWKHSDLPMTVAFDDRMWFMGG